jgi:hypothetical protein
LSSNQASPLTAIKPDEPSGARRPAFRTSDMLKNVGTDTSGSGLVKSSDSKKRRTRNRKNNYSTISSRCR